MINMDSVHMIHYIIGDKNTSICGVQQLKCVAGIEEKMVQVIFLDSLHDVDSGENVCKCLPSCYSINYDIETSSAKFDSAKWMRAFDTPMIRSVTKIE